MSVQWKGVMPAVTTKFTDNDTLDLVNFEVNIKAQLKELILTNDTLKAKTTEVKGKVSEIQGKIDGFIFPVKKYLHYHHQYVEGWFQSIGTEIALPKKQKDELLESCQSICVEHLEKLNINEDSTQNTIYAKN